ncbi:MAG: hypothetical protein K0R09_3944, partial [Clostridiales bacterium]|nr:hypothetical protein [Clostridiales bacterium]
MLDDIAIMVKGTVIDYYFKEYKYETYSDKFEKNGKLKNSTYNIVYVIKVDSILYSKYEENLSSTIKVESLCSNGCYATDKPLYSLKVNRQYILPLYFYGEDIFYYSKDKYAGGDIKRDSNYDIIYPFAPQIEVTLDNKYIFHHKWNSLINSETIDVNDELADLYKLKLRSDKAFIDDLKQLINKNIRQ